MTRPPHSHPRLRGCLWAVLSLPLLLVVAACGDDDKPYPAILSEMADMVTDDSGVSHTLELDNGQSLSIANPLTSLHPKVRYRVMCGFTVQDSQATIYSLEGAYLLRDSSLVAKTDPTSVLSVWRAGQYVNLHLTPTGQDGEHYWGYRVDSLTSHHAHLSLHHDQHGDPLSYTSHLYASLPVDSIKGITQGDTITLHINTFKGIKTWTMKR